MKPIGHFEIGFCREGRLTWSARTREIECADRGAMERVARQLVAEAVDVHQADRVKVSGRLELPAAGAAVGDVDVHRIECRRNWYAE